MIFRFLCIVISILLFGGFFGGTVFAGEPEDAPLNPEFIKYMQLRTPQSMISDDGYWLGYVPVPTAHSTAKPRENKLVNRGYAVSYDLRTQNKLTTVKNQGGCGSCWAFATMGSLESYGKPGDNWNFSEQDLNVNHGYDAAECAGGNDRKAAAYLARWDGPLPEGASPYPYGTGAPIRAAANVSKHVQQVMFLPARSGYLDNNTIKYFVTTYGAVMISYFHSDTYMDATDMNYYCTSSALGTNHAVCVIGWDDNYDKNNFKTAAPGNGAFIIRNSWGTGRHDNGYFYMSYYDQSFAPAACFNNAESTGNYERVYQYDPLGWVSATSFGGTVGWGANIFTAEDNRSLKAVSFYLSDVNASYDIFIYTGVTAGSPRSGTLAATTSGSKTYSGYYTVELDSPVALSNGERFSVVIKFTNSSYIYSICKEKVIASYSSAATANAGESFYGSNGSSWTDISATGENVCIKAFTSYVATRCTDFNGDGKTDFLLRNYQYGFNQVWYMDGITRTGSAQLPRIANTTWVMATAGDFNNDGKTDIVLHNYQDGSNQIWLMNGAAKSSYVILPRIPDTNWQIETAGDFNNDGKTDLVLRNYSTGYNQVWYMDGVTRTGSAMLPRITNLNWRFDSCDDFNSDGKPDLVLRNYQYGTNQVWYMDGVSKTGSAMLPRIPDIKWRFESCGDFNNDGKSDLILRHYDTGLNQVWYMDGVTRTGSAMLPRIPDTNWRISNH